MREHQPVYWMEWEVTGLKKTRNTEFLTFRIHRGFIVAENLTDFLHQQIDDILRAVDIFLHLM